MFPKDKEHLVNDNMGLVKDIAFKMAAKVQNALVDLNDLIQVGSMGLMHAAKHYEPSQGCTFSTYAHKTIRGYMMRELSSRTAIRAPVNVVNLALTICRRHQQDEDRAQLAEKHGVTLEAIEKAFYYLSLSTLSADRVINEDYEAGFYNIKGVYADHSGVLIDEFINTTPKRNRERYRHILNGLMEEKTLRDIAAGLGISYQRVGILKQDLPKLYEEYERRSAL